MNSNLKRKYQIALRRYIFTPTRKKYASYFGCSKEYFIKWIELQFEPGMSWDNYGVWELDHVLPVALFDLQIPSECEIALNFINVRPIFKASNKLKAANPNIAFEYFQIIQKVYDNTVVQELLSRAGDARVSPNVPSKVLDWLRPLKVA